MPRSLQLKALFLLCFLVYLPLQAQSRIVTDLSGKGWKLWFDKNASWKNDELYLPGTEVSSMQTTSPTGGWSALGEGIEVSVPGTVEEYLQVKPGPEGDLKGVSWWYRTIKIPENSIRGKLLLRFEAARYRSEVFVNQRLVGYDLTGNTPFEVDITRFAKAGETIQLAVRVTDPGGNYDWRDGEQISWGNYKVPGSHAFGGITGRVKLISCADVYVNDIYIRNTPAITEVHPQISIINSGSTRIVRTISIQVVEKKNPAIAIFNQEMRQVALKPGENLINTVISAPTAKLWDTEHPNLYICKVSIANGEKAVDEDSRQFGFRWFEPTGQGADAMFRLNGKRIVLRTAISWGYWPINGIYPTEEMAEKQIRIAKSMGLNMLSFHRCVGSPVVLEKADELGLLYYEEPGNYRSGQDINNQFGHTLMHEKVMRMVKRDRSHPALVMFNLINEAGSVSDDQLKIHISDILDAHKLDPTRIFTRTSAWCRSDENEQARIHVRPNDTTVYWHGWYDFHHAGGPAVWNQDFYKNPTDYYNYTGNKKDIVFFGEEGALSTPPRLEKIKTALDASPVNGWDGAMYLDWFNVFDSFLTRKNLRQAFPTVDSLTVAMGNISIEHQGRKIETIRLDNYTDGYAINGWESEIVENHSGVVDCFRNIKGDTALIAWYNQPLYIAVKLRKQVLETKDSVMTDFYIINEKNLTGVYNLLISVKNPLGKEMYRKYVTTAVAGGDVFGQLIAEGIAIPVSALSGMHHIDVTLLDRQGIVRAVGREDFLAVDWRSDKLSGTGAVWEHNPLIKNFLANEKTLFVSNYSNDSGHLDWVVVSRPPSGGSMSLIPKDQFVTADGLPGATVTFYKDEGFQQKISQRTDPDINFIVPMGSTPDPSVTTTERYNARWETKLMPIADGTYFLELQASGFAKLIIDGDTLIRFDKNSGGHDKVKLELRKGKRINLTITFNQIKNSVGKCRLEWSVPEVNAPDPQKLIDRVASEGTTLILADNADTWMDLIAKNTTLTCSGKFQVGSAWLGGVHFVKQHPLFNGLPVNTGMNWPYQAVVKNGADRFGLEMDGEELVVGAYHCYPMKMGTAVGVISCGKGKIIVSTLDICGNLVSTESSANVAKKILCNFIQYSRNQTN